MLSVLGYLFIGVVYYIARLPSYEYYANISDLMHIKRFCLSRFGLCEMSFFVLIAVKPIELTHNFINSANKHGI